MGEASRELTVYLAGTAWLPQGSRSRMEGRRKAGAPGAPQRGFDSLGILWRETPGQACHVPLDQRIGSEELGGKGFQ